MAGSRENIADLENGDGMEGGVPAPPRIPDVADGVVRAAVVADYVGCVRRKDRTRRNDAGREVVRIPMKYLANLLTAGTRSR